MSEDKLTYEEYKSKVKYIIPENVIQDLKRFHGQTDDDISKTLEYMLYSEYENYIERAGITT